MQVKAEEEFRAAEVRRKQIEEEFRLAEEKKRKAQEEFDQIQVLKTLCNYSAHFE